MRLLLYFLLILPICNANSIDFGNLTSEFKTKAYKFHMELGCRDEGVKKGDSIENTNILCSCIIDTLNKNISNEQLSEAADYAYRGKQREEFEIMGPFYKKVQGCSDLDLSKNNDIYKNNIPSKNLIGEWLINYKNCSESYNFMENGTVIITSRDEITENIYSISDIPGSTGRNKLTIETVKDNGKKDCANSSKDSIGEISEIFLLINYEGTMAYFCNSETNKRCSGPLEKTKPNQSLKHGTAQSAAP